MMRTNVQYDLVFLDPPYGHNIVEQALVSLHKAQWLNHNALIVIEVGAREEVDLPEWCEMIESRVYGSTKLVIVRGKREGD